MKKTALIVTILLAAASLLTHTICGGVLGWQAYRTMNGGGAVVMEQPDKPEIVEPVDAPVATPEPVALPERVEMETYFEDSMDYAIIRAYSGSEEVWSRELTPQQSTELDSFSELGIVDGLYLYSDVGTVTALDLATGGIVWENSDFGGAVSGFDWDEQGNLYLSGYYGPDFFMMNTAGQTIQRIDSLHEDYYWAIDIRKLPEDAVEVTMSMSAYTDDGLYPIRVDLNDWSCTVGEQAAQLETWRWIDAYAEEIRSEEEEYAGYALLTVGGDIPVLYRNGNYTAQGDAVSIYDPYLDMVHTYSIGIDSLQYVFMENLLREEYGHMGDYGDTIFCVEDGDFLVIAYGEYTEGQYSTDYKWMDQPVSEREYEQKLRAAFPIEDASYAFDETMSREEMLSLLE